MSGRPVPSTIALVGCGRWGAYILRDLLALECRVTVVARSAATAARAREGGAERVVGDIGELGAVDGAVVATPITAHAGAIGALLPLGVPIFCEKPLCTDAEEARRLDRAAAGRLFVMDKWRYHPGIEALADIARTQELGPVCGLTSVREQWGSPHRDADTLWVHLPHDLAIGLEILGELAPVRSARAELLDGAVVGLHGTLGDRPWLVVSHSAAAPATRRMVRLVCEGGTATLADGYDDALHVTAGFPTRRTEPERRPIDPEWPLLRELRAFVEHVRGGPPPRTGAGDHVQVIERLQELRRHAGLER